ncbi:hypothetical protein [Eilatimonas milleporae]|uniref:Uncharacterized protein n=1 Tax=Eilatimonas milleporae TaxID=911205 RepID=A0A3M0CG29_9PROT|nr:hypothetical protein [Eilatimonas milleporae]RMB07935.1 hypothetical protein BXY39_2029 [Eilatimonas milleporae]
MLKTPIPPVRVLVLAGFAFWSWSWTGGIHANDMANDVALEPDQGTVTLCADGRQDLCPRFPRGLGNVASVEPKIGYEPTTTAGRPGHPEPQTYFDYFGWQAFVALNWPVDGLFFPIGTPTADQFNHGPRRWNAFRSKQQIFAAQNLSAAASAEEKERALLNRQCSEASGRPILFEGSKFTISEFNEPFEPYPLIDRHGNYAVYDIRISPFEIAYLLNPDFTGLNLTTKAGQEKFLAQGGTYDFPGDAANPLGPGAMEIKTAWRIMTDKDDLSRYYTTDVTIAIARKNRGKDTPACIDATVGLVGMHIMQKFSRPKKFAPFWSWASFEHVDTAPYAQDARVSPVSGAVPIPSPDALATPTCDAVQTGGDTTGTDYAFFNPSCTDGGQSCTVNGPPRLRPKQTAYLWASAPPYAADYLTDGRYGTQVARCWRPYDSAAEITRTFKNAWREKAKALGVDHLVWENYEMIGTQWAVASQAEFTNPPLLDVKPFSAPVYMVNSTMETYVQTNEIPVGVLGSTGFHFKGPASCVACHNLATDAAGNPSNLSFLPSAAK